VKRSRAKGRTYFYFRTGQLDSRGREILARLPDQGDPGFGAAYAAHLSVRTKRETATANAQPELTVERLCQLYETSQHFRDLSCGSQRLYGISLRYFREMLPTAPAGLLERRDVVRLVDGRATQPGAANSLLRSINALYKWARERGHVENNPCRDVAQLRVGEHEPWPEHVLSAALAADDERVRLGTHLLLYTAQRIGDVVGMRWTDIREYPDPLDPSRRIKRLDLVQQKTKQFLSIRVHAALEAELARHGRSLGYILAGRGARPITAALLRTVLQEFASAQGAKVVPHGLRKNAVNALLEAGCSAAETASISGQSLQMVEHYAKARSQVRLGDAAVLKWQGHRP
jgi:integrase